MFLKYVELNWIAVDNRMVIAFNSSNVNVLFSYKENWYNRLYISVLFITYALWWFLTFIRSTNESLHKPHCAQNLKCFSYMHILQRI